MWWKPLILSVPMQHAVDTHATEVCVSQNAQI